MNPGAATHCDLETFTSREDGPRHGNLPPRGRRRRTKAYKAKEVRASVSSFASCAIVRTGTRAVRRGAERGTLALGDPGAGTTSPPDDGPLRHAWFTATSVSERRPASQVGLSSPNALVSHVGEPSQPEAVVKGPAR
jgi:hypothetical protein